LATYLVTQTDAPKGAMPNMVEARTAQQAINHVAKGKFGAQVLTTREAVSWAKQGVDIETAGGDAEPAAEEQLPLEGE
jgi:hypothetical protein